MGNPITSFEWVLKHGNGIKLSSRQKQALSVLLGKNRAFTKADYARLSETTSQQARLDLEALVRAGILHLSASGRSSQYRFVRLPAVIANARKWTEARLEGELKEFLQGYDKWPAFEQWKAKGMVSLYQAVSNHGGVKRWRRRLGF